MLDRFLALVSWTLLATFMAVLVFFVAEPALTVVALGGLLLAGYDFWRATRTPSRRRD